jgi:hypothetical protein
MDDKGRKRDEKYLSEIQEFEENVFPHVLSRKTYE